MESDEITAQALSDKDEFGKKLSFGDMLDKLCVYYMSIGVPYEEFWYGDYTKLKYYVRLHNLNVERQNEQLWLQGMYFYEALSVALSKSFNKHSNAKYPDKPHRLTPLTDEEKELEKKKQIEEFRAALDEMGRRFEAKHKRERELALKKQQQDGENIGSTESNISRPANG